MLHISITYISFLGRGSKVAALKKHPYDDEEELMSHRRRQSDDLAKKIRHFYALEKDATLSKGRRAYNSALRWMLMLYREGIKDDVKIRAESLSFLMIFSLLPLIAGTFFIFTVFTQFGMVQEALSNFLNHFLGTIPDENRRLVEEYVLRFKDAYLHTISGRSGKLGIFALAILIWVGLQTFNNIDRTINFIWSSDRERPFLEKARNFIVVSVGAPFVIIASLSIPLVLRKLDVTRDIFLHFPVLFSLMNFFIPIALIFGIFALLYRYVPVRRVRWKSALVGSVFAATCLQITNAIMHLYFQIGTNTAYGKAAVVPLICFWIYLVWIIVIVGAELSYLVQNEQFVIQSLPFSHSFYEGECLLVIMSLLQKNFEAGHGPVTWTMLFQRTYLQGRGLKRIVDYLEERKMLIPVALTASTLENEYTLARSLRNTQVAEILRDFMLDQRRRLKDCSISDDYYQSLEHWLQFFGNRTIGEYLRQDTKPA